MKVNNFDKQLEDYSEKNKDYLKKAIEAYKELKILKQNNGKFLKFKL